jgi:hypothetical protein
LVRMVIPPSSRGELPCVSSYPGLSSLPIVVQLIMNGRRRFVSASEPLGANDLVRRKRWGAWERDARKRALGVMTRTPTQKTRICRMSHFFRKESAVGKRTLQLHRCGGSLGTQPYLSRSGLSRPFNPLSL